MSLYGKVASPLRDPVKQDFPVTGVGQKWPVTQARSVNQRASLGKEKKEKEEGEINQRQTRNTHRGIKSTNLHTQWSDDRSYRRNRVF